MLSKLTSVKDMSAKIPTPTPSIQQASSGTRAEFRGYQALSVVDLVFTPKKDTSVEEVNNAIMEAATGKLRGILGCTDKPLVSSDFNHDPHSSTFALNQTQILEGKLVRILTWYDNEWGFSTRMTDTALEMARHI